MSFEAANWVKGNSVLKGNSRFVLVVLADRAHEIGDKCWPSINRVASDTGLSRSTVKRHIAKAEEVGELLVFPQAGGDQNCPPDKRPNLYGLCKVPGYVMPEGLVPRKHNGSTPRSGDRDPDRTPVAVHNRPIGGSDTTDRQFTDEPQTSLTSIKPPTGSMAKPDQSHHSNEGITAQIVEQLLKERALLPLQSEQELTAAVFQMLERGHSPEQVKAAGMKARAWSANGLATQLPTTIEQRRPRVPAWKPEPSPTPKPEEFALGLAGARKASADAEASLALKMRDEERTRRPLNVMETHTRTPQSPARS